MRDLRAAPSKYDPLEFLRSLSFLVSLVPAVIFAMRPLALLKRHIHTVSIRLTCLRDYASIGHEVSASLALTHANISELVYEQAF